MYKTVFAVIAAIFLCGCTSTRSVITEFDQSGKITKRKETSESVISSLMTSTKDKSVIIWEDGWAAYISGSTGTVEDPTPHGKIFCGKVNTGWISLQKDQRDVSEIAQIIQATKSDITVALDGVKSSGSDLSVNKKQ